LLASLPNQPTNQSSKQPPTTEAAAAAAPTPASTAPAASLASASLSSAPLASAARSMTELACAFITAKVHFLLPLLLPEPDRVGLAPPDCKQCSNEGQEISEGNFGIFNFLKNKQNIFLIFALASKKWLHQKKKFAF
jgi:hypothetical protein